MDVGGWVVEFVLPPVSSEELDDVEPSLRLEVKVGVGGAGVGDGDEVDCGEGEGEGEADGEAEGVAVEDGDGDGEEVGVEDGVMVDVGEAVGVKFPGCGVFKTAPSMFAQTTVIKRRKDAVNRRTYILPTEEGMGA